MSDTNSPKWYSALAALPGSFENGSEGEDVLQHFQSGTDLLINVGLLVRNTNNCDREAVASWSCDRCEKYLQPEEEFIVEAAQSSNRVTCFRYGKLWFVLFRGSRNLANWKSDFKIGVVPIPGDMLLAPVCDRNAECSKATCHGGFFSVWTSLREQLLLELRKRSVRPGDKSVKLFFSGHSMGGAVASVAAWNLCVLGFNVLGVLTFESPLVFNYQAALVYQSLLGTRTLRTTNQNDPVPHMPSHQHGYTHVGNELYMRAGEAHLCTFEEVRRCRNTMNRSDNCHCSSQDRFSFFTPYRHCLTEHFLTFNFCRCNGGSMSSGLAASASAKTETRRRLTRIANNFGTPITPASVLSNSG